MNKRSDTQRLVDIMFEVGQTIHMHHSYFKTRNREELCEWIIEQLDGCGFPTMKVGSSWGVLVDKKQKDKGWWKMAKLKVTVTDMNIELESICYSQVFDMGDGFSNTTFNLNDKEKDITKKWLSGLIRFLNPIEPNETMRQLEELQSTLDNWIKEVPTSSSKTEKKK